jgi:glycosyltransferase involved in cell wall biosynthesis
MAPATAAEEGTMSAELDLSVLVVHHQQPRQLAQALASVRLQIPCAKEVLVVDDGSGWCPELDSTIASCGLEVRLLRLAPCSGGPATPRNQGLAAAQGHYVAFLDADDAWLPGHLAALERSWAVDPAAVVHGDQIVWGPNLHRPFLQAGLPTQASGAATYAALRRGGNRIFLSSTAGPTLTLLKAGFDPEHLWEDFDLWLRLSKVGQRFRHSGHCGTLYRLTPGSRSARRAARRQGAHQLASAHFNDMPRWRWPLWLQRNSLPC